MDKQITITQFLKRYFPLISTVTFGLIILMFVLRFVYTRPQIVASLIENDIGMISLSLERIDARCSILKIVGDKSNIDFLNVKKFEGSVVGPLNLAYPENWEGPYLKSNPTLSGTFYQIVKAKDGVFIVPGEGVALPNDIVIGKDLVINQDLFLENHIVSGGLLSFKGRSFGKKLDFKIGDWKTWELQKDKVKELDRMLEELNTAMPFTKNEEKELEEIYIV